MVTKRAKRAALTCAFMGHPLKSGQMASECVRIEQLDGAVRSVVVLGWEGGNGDDAPTLLVVDCGGDARVRAAEDVTTYEGESEAVALASMRGVQVL